MNTAKFANTTLPNHSVHLEKFTADRQPRVQFDPANTMHRRMYRDFQATNRWVMGCPFKLDWPALTVPDMCQQRLVAFYLATDKKIT